MNIYEALTADHLKVQGLLNELVSLEDKDFEKRTLLVKKIRDDLIPHSRAEEAVFYNTMRLVDESKVLAMHGYKEHLEAEGLLRLLQTMDKFDLTWKPTAKKLKSALEHHIKEEEGEMFPKAQELFTEDDAIAMAKTFKAMKPEIKEEGLMKTTLDMVANLMPPRFSERFRKYEAVPKQ